MSLLGVGSTKMHGGTAPGEDCADRLGSLPRRLAVLLLVSGQTTLAALAAAIRDSLRAVLGWVQRRCAAVMAVPLAAAAAAARIVAGLVRRVLSLSPVALLTQLVSLQLGLAANDDHSDGARVSARIGAQLALLFGSIRLRTTTCVQLAPPSLKPVKFLLPSTSSGSTRGAAPECAPRPSPRIYGDEATTTSAVASAAHTAGSAQHQALQLHGGRHFVGNAQQWQQEAGESSGATAARTVVADASSCDNVLHLLCSSELKTAILRFLGDQADGSQGYVLLPSARSSDSSLRASAVAPPQSQPYFGCDTTLEQQAASASSPTEQPASPELREQSSLRCAVAARQLSGVCGADGDTTPTVALHSARSVRESCELFEGLGAVRGREAAAPSSVLPGPVAAGSLMRDAEAGFQEPVAAAAAAAALYASAAPHGRISPIAHPAKHGRNVARPKQLPAAPFIPPITLPSMVLRAIGSPASQASGAAPHRSPPNSGSGLRGLLEGGAGVAPLF